MTRVVYAHEDERNGAKQQQLKKTLKAKVLGSLYLSVNILCYTKAQLLAG